MTPNCWNWLEPTASPGSKPPGTSAEIDFLVDKSKVLSEAVSKLAYKAGKVAAFSHTNFIIVGKSVLEEDVSKCLDYFIRPNFYA